MIDAADGPPRPMPVAFEKPKRRNVFALGGAQLITWSITLRRRSSSFIRSPEPLITSRT